MTNDPGKAGVSGNSSLESSVKTSSPAVQVFSKKISEDIKRKEHDYAALHFFEHSRACLSLEFIRFSSGKRPAGIVTGKTMLSQPRPRVEESHRKTSSARKPRPQERREAWNPILPAGFRPQLSGRG
jgi:hypothetical protein